VSRLGYFWILSPESQTATQFTVGQLATGNDEGLENTRDVGGIALVTSQVSSFMSESDFAFQ
jgi:hypothetical protein